LKAEIADGVSVDAQIRLIGRQNLFTTINVMLFHMAGYARVSPRLDFRPTIATNSELQLARIKFVDQVR